MARVQNTNNFNNLLYSIDRRAKAEIAEHYGARVPLGVNDFKGYSRTDEILNTDRAKVNGKMGDFKYELPFAHSRPYGGFDAKFDPTILNAVRKNYVDVSGLLIAPEDLPRKQNKNTSQHPLILKNIIT
jgi:hypothetical protein